jgi:hypothetical protein
MIPDRDIWRSANLLIREHKADAEVVAARRADEMLERGDREGQLVWLRIKRAIVEFAGRARGETELVASARVWPANELSLSKRCLSSGPNSMGKL